MSASIESKHEPHPSETPSRPFPVVVCEQSPETTDAILGALSTLEIRALSNLEKLLALRAQTTALIAGEIKARRAARQ